MQKGRYELKFFFFVEVGLYSCTKKQIEYAKLNLTLCVFLRAKTSSMQINYENSRIQT